MEAKAQYSRSLRNLESISEDIHRQRSKNSSSLSTPTAARQGCVGAEVTDTMESVRRRLNSDEVVQKAIEDHQKNVIQKPPISTGRYRSSLVLDLDMDIDLVESIDPVAPPSRTTSFSSTSTVTVKHFDDYQVLDIMPFFEKEKKEKRKNKSYYFNEDGQYERSSAEGTSSSASNAAASSEGINDVESLELDKLKLDDQNTVS